MHEIQIAGSILLLPELQKPSKSHLDICFLFLFSFINFKMVHITHTMPFIFLVLNNKSIILCSIASALRPSHIAWDQKQTQRSLNMH